jgi:hypothetical protein
MAILVNEVLDLPWRFVPLEFRREAQDPSNFSPRQVVILIALDETFSQAALIALV